MMVGRSIECRIPMGCFSGASSLGLKVLVDFPEAPVIFPRVPVEKCRLLAALRCIWNKKELKYLLNVKPSTSPVVL